MGLDAGVSRRAGKALGRVRCGSLAGENPSQSEIDEIEISVMGSHEVLGCYVLVDDVLGVHDLEDAD